MGVAASYLGKAVSAPGSHSALSEPPCGQGGRCLVPTGEGGSPGSRQVSGMLLTGLIGCDQRGRPLLPPLPASCPPAEGEEMQLSVEVQALHVASTNGGEVGAGLGLVSSVVLRWDGHCLQLLALPAASFLPPWLPVGVWGACVSGTRSRMCEAQRKPEKTPPRRF